MSRGISRKIHVLSVLNEKFEIPPGNAFYTFGNGK
jgi:hypothetical protein